MLIELADKDNSANLTKMLQSFGLQNAFSDRKTSADYIAKLPRLLTLKGFPAASVDSVFYDTSSAYVLLYLGIQLKGMEINVDSADKDLLSNVGWDKTQKIDFTQLDQRQQNILSYYETKGYPFAEVSLENIKIEEDKLKATLKITKGPLYRIDSIRVYGKVKIKNFFLQKYLGVENGSFYNKTKLENISKRLLELPYLQEQRWDMSMLGSGAILNLYLQPKRSSQINFLVGFLPSSSKKGKLQLTADVNLNLKNALGAGETILVNWQQLQQQSPRLNLGYQHPYIFNSRFGLDAAFDLLKRDTSFLQLHARLGMQYGLSTHQSGEIFLQNQRTYLLSGGFDTNRIRITKTLPPNIDVSSGSLGISYQFLNTNYLYNPRSGNEISVTGIAGLRKISKNTTVVNLKDPANAGFNFNSLYDSIKLNSYQFRITLAASHYFPVGKKSTLKTQLSSGLLESPTIFRNELFQIGGYRLLRGFNEESIYANQYAVLTAEYRYLTGLNSFLYSFADAAITRTHFKANDFSNSFLSTGLGLSFETSFGLLNVSYAIGKRNDAKFDLREASKIHFGYINYF